MFWPLLSCLVVVQSANIPEHLGACEFNDDCYNFMACTVAPPFYCVCNFGSCNLVDDVPDERGDICFESSAPFYDGSEETPGCYCRNGHCEDPWKKWECYENDNCYNFEKCSSRRLGLHEKCRCQEALCEKKPPKPCTFSDNCDRYDDCSSLRGGGGQCVCNLGNCDTVSYNPYVRDEDIQCQDYTDCDCKTQPNCVCRNNECKIEDWECRDTNDCLNLKETRNITKCEGHKCYCLGNTCEVDRRPLLPSEGSCTFTPDCEENVPVCKVKDTEQWRNNPCLCNLDNCVVDTFKGLGTECVGEDTSNCPCKNAEGGYCYCRNGFCAAEAWECNDTPDCEYVDKCRRSAGGCVCENNVCEQDPFGG